MSGAAPALGSLYSGVGGSDLGFERAGFRVAWQVERDPWRARVLSRHWPAVPRHRDVALVAREALEPVDVLAVTPPAADPDWLGPVWPVVERLRPAFLVIASGSRCVDALEAGLARCGYSGGALSLSCGLRRALGGRVNQRQAFAVGYRDLSPEAADVMMGVHAFDACDAEFPTENPESAVDVFEVLAGLPARWSCVCGREAAACSETAERLLAANDCLSPTLCLWLGRRFRTLMETTPATAGEVATCRS